MFVEKLENYMFIDDLKNKIPDIDSYFSDMKLTKQDVKYHAEGDVYIHTLMVLDEVEKLNIHYKDKALLRYISVLHDIGKPACTRISDDDITSYGHSRIGYHIAIELLSKLNLPFNDMIQICNIIKNHSKPFHTIDNSDPEREVISLSLECDLKLLYELCYCDNTGRIFGKKDDSYFNLEYFKEVAIKLDCFNKPFKFKSSIAKFNYLYKKTHHFSDEPYDDTKSKVWLLSGLPGSGKDYYINKNLSHLNVISLDEIRNNLKIKPTDEQGLVIQTAKEKAREYLRKGVDFIWNGTNTSKLMRDGLISLFDNYNAYITIVYIHKNLNDILEMNKNRDRVVPEKVIRKLFRNIDIPVESEAHEILYIS